MEFFIALGIIIGNIGIIAYYYVTFYSFFDYEFDTKKEFLLHLIPFFGLGVFLVGLWNETVTDVWKDLE